MQNGNANEEKNRRKRRRSRPQVRVAAQEAARAISEIFRRPPSQTNLHKTKSSAAVDHPRDAPANDNPTKRQREKRRRDNTSEETQKKKPRKSVRLQTPPNHHHANKTKTPLTARSGGSPGRTPMKGSPEEGEARGRRLSRRSAPKMESLTNRDSSSESVRSAHVSTIEMDALTLRDPSPENIPSRESSPTPPTNPPKKIGGLIRRGRIGLAGLCPPTQW